MKPKDVLPIFFALAMCETTGPVLAQHAGDFDSGDGVQPVISKTKPGASYQTSDSHIEEWFRQYDRIRHDAQMGPAERRRADLLLSKGLSMIIPGEEQAATQALLSKLVGRYRWAVEQLKQMPLFPETEKLHCGYYQYFRDARNLFSDYLKVQDNLFAKDATGKALAGTLMQRRQSLETLDQSNKQMDEHLRQKHGIAAYRY